MFRTTTLGIFAVITCLCFANANAVNLLNEQFDGAPGTQPTGFTEFASSPLINQNDGAGEYEQRRTGLGGGNVAVALFSDADEVDKGLWRDVTITSNTRFSGGAENDNGMIFRARDVTGTSGAAAGDFYMVRVQDNDEIALFRNNDGSFTSLATAAVDLSGPILNHDWQITVSNIANPGQDHVRIQAALLPDGGGAPLASIDFTDTSANALTRAGGVGYRSFNNDNATTRSTFDDLNVTSDNPGLLWYDDFTDGTAPRVTTPDASGSRSDFTVSGNKLASVSGSGTAIAFVDFPSWTSDPQWENVEVTALMRLNTNNTGGNQQSGILARGNDITNAGNTESEFYLYRLNRLEANNESQAQLLRKNAGGGFDVLETLTLDSLDSVPESENIFLSLKTINLGDNVLIEGFASLNDDFSNPFGAISFLDTSASRILGPGTAGVRVFGVGPVNFDNFAVNVAVLPIPEPATAALGLMGIAGLVMRRRRNA